MFHYKLAVNSLSILDPVAELLVGDLVVAVYVHLVELVHGGANGIKRCAEFPQVSLDLGPGDHTILVGVHRLEVLAPVVPDHLVHLLVRLAATGLQELLTEDGVVALDGSHGTLLRGQSNGSGGGDDGGGGDYDGMRPAMHFQLRRANTSYVTAHAGQSLSPSRPAAPLVVPENNDAKIIIESRARHNQIVDRIFTPTDAANSSSSRHSPTASSPSGRPIPDAVSSPTSRNNTPPPRNPR